MPKTSAPERDRQLAESKAPSPSPGTAPLSSRIKSGPGQRNTRGPKKKRRKRKGPPEFRETDYKVRPDHMILTSGQVAKLKNVKVSAVHRALEDGSLKCLLTTGGQKWVPVKRAHEWIPSGVHIVGRKKAEEYRRPSVRGQIVEHRDSVKTKEQSRKWGRRQGTGGPLALLSSDRAFALAPGARLERLGLEYRKEGRRGSHYRVGKLEVFPAAWVRGPRYYGDGEEFMAEFKRLVAMW